ncbi:indolepyruvate ferredoxin oxidoreductase [Pseudonocardia sulfidoxydans NBRC 16205]|uniref:Indolepyruvate ferredoxin oxidoreductase n=1 Tax=Pseudonocardia sulfidoxydans NBRC 16205 TaxID=1223511 RepID=A0A511DTB6_9PSEU|nr:indolepyruvate ferredoxin oxidoreductase family protein [Pseudonocardia sulfidoxydans]GEL26308.1 indolepyruvate ferredoxin oxidoreductase [Pseudonocardia sulfidoxydans NBRC 16205]
MTIVEPGPVIVAPTRAYSLDDRYVAEDGVVHMTGVQALVRLLFQQRRHDRAAGLDTRMFVSGYEGSPLGGFDLELGRRKKLLDEHGVVFTPGLNEESAATAVQGSQLAAIAGGLRHDGVTGFWYGKAPGLDRASDAIRHANLMGTNRTGGVLAVVGDDPAAKSSSVPCTSEMTFADLAVPTLYPADPTEVVTLGLHGVALSRASGLWAGMKMTTAVADGSSTVHAADFGAVRPVMPSATDFRHTVTGRLLQPTLGPLERDLHGARTEAALRYAAANGLNRIPVRTGDDRIGIVAAGKTWLDLRHALDVLGLHDDELRRRGVRLLKLGMVHPVEPGIVAEFASGLREIVVVEEKRAFLETAIKDVLYGSANAPMVRGKSLFPPHGELGADDVAAGLATVLADLPSVIAWQEARRPAPRGPVMLPLAATRTPYFCSGCPHNTSTAPPEDSLLAAGIGCHTMVLLMDPAQVGEVVGLTQMGGEGTQWIGMAPFVEASHLVQNLGDGTFHHSGSLAIRAAVAAGVNITYKLLHNGTVAMTGGQDAVGALGVPAITRLLAVEGVARTIVTTDDVSRYRGVTLAGGVEVWHRDRLEEAQRVLAGTPGVTVLIHDQECAAEKRRKRKRGKASTPSTRVMINERVCEGCGDCGQKSNCLSVQPVDTEFGRKTQIDQSSCNLDFSCLDGDCPSFLSVVPGSVSFEQAPHLAAAALRDPVPCGRTDVTVRLAGVGGTGVVTVSAILATAAVIAGREVRGLDQTGLAQKGGAVVSDLRISASGLDGPGKLGARECDLYLGADLLVAADKTQLAVTDPSRTVAVVSTTQVPTGAMVTDPTVAFPQVDAVVRRITDSVRAGTYLDARGLSERLFGEDQYANMILLGAGYQMGALPVPAAAIERAIELNGAAVATNIQAFRRGRQAVADPAALDRVLSPAAAAAPTDLAGIVATRVEELTAYQSAAYAASYTDLVERVRVAEDAAVPGSTALASAVAVNLHKLMAYKDEYEVARLSLDPALAASVEKQFGEGAKVAYKLHPPVLRALGMNRKIALRRTAGPAFRTLRAMRRLRGTRFDPFGLAEVRRVERSLITEYRTVVEDLLNSLSVDSLPRAVEIANLPDMVRGYEDIKLASVARYREALAARSL